MNAILETISKIKLKTAAIKTALIAGIMAMCTTAMYCDANAGGGLVGRTQAAMANIYQGIYEVGIKIFPVVIVCVIIALFVSHDDRAIKVEIKSLIVCIILYALLLVMGNSSEGAVDVFNQTIEGDAGIQTNG